MSDYERKEELKQMLQIHTQVVPRTPKVYDDDYNDSYDDNDCNDNDDDEKLKYTYI